MLRSLDVENYSDASGSTSHSWLSFLRLCLPRKSIPCNICLYSPLIGTLNHSVFGNHSTVSSHLTQYPTCRGRRTGTSPSPRAPICTLPPRPLSGNLLGSPSPSRLSAPVGRVMVGVNRIHLQTSGCLLVKSRRIAHRRRLPPSRRNRHGGACVCFAE